MKFADRRRIALVLVAAAFVAAGCGGSSSTSSESSPTPSPVAKKKPAVHYAAVDACKLLSADDASTAAGAKVDALPTGAGASTASICIFGSSGSSDSNQAGVLMIVEVYPDQAAADATQTDQVAAGLAAQFGVTGVAKPKIIDNIGDKAVEYQVTRAQGGAVGMFVFRANVLMFIIVSPADATKIDALPVKVEVLARTVVTNLDTLPHS